MPYQLADVSVSEAKQIANSVLATANQTIEVVTEQQKKAFQYLWFTTNEQGGKVARTAVAVNAIFDEMDAVAPGQSATLFAQSWALAQLILSVDPTALTESEYLPPLPYEIADGHVTVSEQE